MGWRLHLSTQPVAAVHFVEDGVRAPQLAVWDSRHNVHFYDCKDGTPLGELRLAEQRLPGDLNEPDWREVVDTLRAPNGRFLPAVYLNRATILQSWDGRLRLYHQHEGGLILEIEGRHIALDREQDGRYLVVGLDRALGLSCAYSDQGLLSVFQQHVRVGTFEVPLALDMDARLNLAVPEAMGRMLLCDGEQLLMLDSAGRIQHRIRLHFTAGALAVSPDGQLVAVADIDDNLVRVYDGTLRPTHQKHAIDLMAEARQVQLLASLPGRKAGLSALDIANDGGIAFALGGVICVTQVRLLDELPQPQPLL